LFHEFLIERPAQVCRYLPTSNLLLDRSILEKTGYLDESFPGAAGEDIDWTIRMRLAGFSLYFEPRAQVLHRPARVGLSDILRHGWWSGRNMSRVRRRYPAEYPSHRLLTKPVLLFVLSPIIALVAACRVLGRSHRPLRDWLTLPAIFLTKLAWTMGAAREARHPESQQSSVDKVELNVQT
jgi:GT2 family glycosyltransferase